MREPGGGTAIYRPFMSLQCSLAVFEFICGGRPTGWSWAQMGFECSMPARPLPKAQALLHICLFVAMAALELQLVGAHLFVGSAQGFMALSLATHPPCK